MSMSLKYLCESAPSAEVEEAVSAAAGAGSSTGGLFRENMLERLPKLSRETFLSDLSACGTEAGSYLRLTDSCITQLKAQGPSSSAARPSCRTAPPAQPPVFKAHRLLYHSA